MKKITITSFIFLLTFCSFAQDRITGHNFATCSEVIAQTGMARTSQPLTRKPRLTYLKLEKVLLMQPLMPLLPIPDNYVGQYKTKCIAALPSKGKMDRQLCFKEKYQIFNF